MTSRTSITWLLLAALWISGVLMALGSKSYDPDDDEPVDPVEVDFVVTSTGSLTLADGTTTDTLSGVTLGGVFEKGGNAGITLREIPVTLNTNTTFTLDVAPNAGDNLLEGSLSVSVSADLEFGVDRLPTSGQLSLVRDGTTTLVTFDGDTNNVVLAVGNTTLPAISFGDLRSFYSDEDQSLDTRFASKAYRSLETLWLIARFSETTQSIVSDNLETLESMGFNMSLTLTCDNTGTPSPTSSVAWTVDPAGSGLGSPGAGDTFEFSWINCQYAEDNRFVQNVLRLANYQLDNDNLPRNRSYTVELSDLIIAEDNIDAGTPTLTRLRADGTLVVSATEGDTVTTGN